MFLDKTITFAEDQTNIQSESQPMIFKKLTNMSFSRFVSLRWRKLPYIISDSYKYKTQHLIYKALLQAEILVVIVTITKKNSWFS